MLWTAVSFPGKLQVRSVLYNTVAVPFSLTQESAVSVSPSDSEADIWERIIYPRGAMSKEAAQRILELAFTDEDRARMHSLAERNRRGEISDDDEAKLDHFWRVGTLLSILKVRARRILRSRTRAS